ncbi:MAG: hypothetical protein KIS85_05120 [Anaerolineales bacterium]|nr:hypothetical protein [Anaerolineales bacterium]
MALDERKQRQNEAKFDSWEALPDGGRQYSMTVPGRSGWKAIYLKQVDADEQTVRFWQEIYDESGALVEEHQKYPEDRGHKKVRS